LSQHQDAESPNDSEELYNIDKEIELLKEIKDIQDELHILLVLLETQTTVLQQAAEAMGSRSESQDTTPRSPRSHAGNTGSSRPGQEAPYSSTFHFGKLHQMVLDQEKRRKTLQIQAEHANKAVSDAGYMWKKLELIITAQSPPGLEAETSKRVWSQIGTRDRRIHQTTGEHYGLVHPRDNHLREYHHLSPANNGLTPLAQAPLSLIATIFSLRIVEFPNDLHLKFVFEYMFGISIAIIFPMVLLVIYTTRLSIAQVIIRLEKRVVNWKWFHKIR
jgi:hypothetical protein